MTCTGGVINALDPGDYGAVTISKALTVDFSSASGLVVAGAGTDAIRVNTANATDRVVLRGINVIGSGCDTPALSGVRVFKAGAVVIEDSAFSNFATAAVNVNTSATSTPTITASGLRIRNGCATNGVNTSVGLLAAPSGGGTARVLVADSVVSDQGTGVRATDGAAVSLVRGVIWGNALGLDAQGTGTIDIDGATQVTGNTVNGAATGVIDALRGDAGAAGAAGATGPMGAAGARGATGPAGRDARAAVLLRATQARTGLGSGITLAYIASRPGAAVLTVRKEGRTVAQARVRIRAGSGGVRWSGRLANGRVAPAGTYSLRLRYTGARAASAWTTVKVGR